MSRDKYIEEMAEIISAVRFHKTSTYIAEALYNAGYRKSTNLAEEIFADIVSKKLFVRDRVGNMRAVVLFDDMAELKKKYESEKDNGN